MSVRSREGQEHSAAAERMARQQRAHRLAERARALAVDEAHVRQPGHEGVVQVLLDEVARLVGGLAE